MLVSIFCSLTACHLDAPAGRAALDMSSIDAMRSEASTSLRGPATAAGPFFAPGIVCS